MNTFLSEKMDAITATAKANFDNIVVRIECPLDTGVKVECYGIKDGLRTSLSIPGGVRDFFLYVEKMRKEKPTVKFNLVEITSDVSKRISTAFSFDENIQRRAEENIRQD